MDCAKIQNLLSEYVDGALTPERAWAAQMHLSVCKPCAQLASELRQTVALLQGAAPATVSPGFDERLAAKLSAAAPEIERARRSRLHAVLAAVSALSDGWYIQRRWAAAIAGAGMAALVVGIGYVSTTPVTRAIAPGAAMHPLFPTRPTALSRDSAFVAACSSEHARYVSGEAIADPAAQTLAARADDLSAAATGAPDGSSD